MEIKSQKIRDRKTLLRKATSWKRRGKGPNSFRSFIRQCWPTVLDRISPKELDHLIAYIWHL